MRLTYVIDYLTVFTSQNLFIEILVYKEDFSFRSDEEWE